MSLTVYIDVKSPYAYLALSEIYKLEDEFGMEADWRYFELDIPSYLGAAEVDNDGEVISSTRTDHQWKKVRYAYMDVRRRANLKGMTILGTQKIWDSKLAGIGMYKAKESGQTVLRRYLDHVYEKFWRRELNIEDLNVVQECLEFAGAKTFDFQAYVEGEGALLLHDIRAQAWDIGVFGVPFILVNDEKFFGSEQIPLIRDRLNSLAKP